MSVQTDRKAAVTDQLLGRYRHDLASSPGFKTVSNAVRKSGIQAVAIDPDRVAAMTHTYSLDLETSAVTHQKQSGRCWMFAALNVLRHHVEADLKLKSFEFSQNYTMFWDKVEKANAFLENILETADEPYDSRVVAFLLDSPVGDGGQWDMFVALVEKYGLVPKDAMPETFQSSQSRAMNMLITLKLREDAVRLRRLVAEGAAQGAVQSAKEKMLAEIYRILVANLGEPPERFDFEYKDKDGGFHAERGLTPRTFVERYVKLNLDDYVSLINAPTDDKPMNRTYTVRFLASVKEGRPVVYLNLPIDELRRVALAQLEDQEPVWFGCDVGKMLDRDGGIMDSRLFDYEGTLGVPFTMTKGERLDYGESRMTHAMVFTGVNLVDGRPNRWKVENSWGTEPGKDGYFVMSDAWFDDHMYQVVVHKKYLSEAQRETLKLEPIVLQPWDPMGSLA